MDPRDAFNSAMFVEQGAHDIGGLLAYLVNNSPLMGDEDREFVLGCHLALETGGIITVADKQQLIRIATALKAAGHDILGGGVEPPLSILQVLKDFAQNKHVLNQNEWAFANHIARKYQQKENMEPSEIQRLMKIYTEKGF